MGENTAIEWAHHTHNIWWGCTKVSDGCTRCYAEAIAKRFAGDQVQWGKHGRRRFMSDRYWQQPLGWNRKAKKRGVRERVFCSSMCDVFEEVPKRHPDRNAMHKARLRLWDLIGETPHLDWLLLTKRPENVLRHAPWEHPARFGLSNVWMGVSIEDQATADKRIRHLLDVPARVRFLSIEPLLGPVDLRMGDVVQLWDGDPDTTVPKLVESDRRRAGLHWAIIGGESGPGARPFCVQYARQIIRQCKDAEVPVFMKQLGANPRAGDDGCIGMSLKSKKGNDPSEWTPDLRVREVPA